MLNLGAVVQAQLDYPQALQCFEEGLRLAKELNNKIAQAAALEYMGTLFFDQELYEEARRSHEEGLAIQREIDNKRGMVWSLNSLSFISTLRAEYKQALTYLKESVLLTRGLDSFPLVIGSLLNVLRIVLHRQARNKQNELAHEEGIVVLAGVIANWLENGDGVQSDYDKQTYDEVMEILKEKLEQPPYATWFAQGKRMSLSQTIEFTLAFISRLEVEA